MVSAMQRPLTSLLRSAAAQRFVAPLVSPRRIDDYLELVDPCWSLSQVRARVVEVKHESRDVTSLLLAPNDNWRGHRAGQHVLLTVTIDGVQQTRSFTLSCAPTAGEPLRVTIKTHAKGHVSRWVNERAQVGDIVTLSQARGEFVLPAVLPTSLLFISGGSGFTPMIAMTQALVAARYQGALTWLHYELDQVPLAHELHALVAQLPNARLVIERTEPKRAANENAHVQAAPLLTDARLQQLVPAWATHETFVCGPAGMMNTVQAMYARAGLSNLFHSEQFQAAWKAQPTAPTLASATARRNLMFTRSGKQSAARPGISLLEQAESAGLTPQHGCRMGICHTCTCKKLSGTVRNELTGETSDARDEEIQLCISTPLSDVSLDL
jgi:stearoyl-CoA 9-desaturase NADPH oxidoreductase